MTSTNRAVHEIRFSNVCLVVWPHDGMTGPTYRVTLARMNYDEDEERGLVPTFGPDDLLVAAKALDAADSWIREDTKTRTETDRTTDGPPGGSFSEWLRKTMSRFA